MGVINGSLGHTFSGRKKKRLGTKTGAVSSRRSHVNNQDIRESRPICFTPTTYRRETTEYLSAPDSNGVAARVDAPRYTGNLIKGIATMHKSNAVPVINEQEMVDISRMRR
jgi:hypothetical protein